MGMISSYKIKRDRVNQLSLFLILTKVNFAVSNDNSNNDNDNDNDNGADSDVIYKQILLLPKIC